MRPYRNLLFIVLLLVCQKTFSQQDVDLHLNAHLLSGKKVLKVKRDFYDPYLWVLSQGNEVYRVNSLTMAVDNFTAVFAAFSNLQFTDIAGRSKDTVFIATNSSSIIEYKKGLFKVINSTDGLPGEINSVGMDHIHINSPGNPGNLYDGQILLIIATTTGIYDYNCVSEQILPTSTPPANNRLFETTYRTEAYSDLGFVSNNDPAKQFATINNTQYTSYGGSLQFNTPDLGYHINTAYYITPNNLIYYQYSNTDVFFLNQVWGTETGLFQNNFRAAYVATAPYLHYLKGIKVNKVTSIYGLTAFGSDANPALIRENLLVGTDKGFYFSSSGYKKYDSNRLSIYNTFTFDADIGNQIINDVCVDATSYSATVCEDGVWVAGNNGLYFLKPDYGKYLGTTQINAIGFENQPDNISATNICEGTSVNAIVNSNAYSGTIIQWYKNGLELPAESKASLNISTAGDYYAILYDPCSDVHFETNHLKVTVISAPVFTFNYPDKIQNCDNTPVTLQTEENPGYSYRWYTDGVLNGNTKSGYIVTQNGKYKVEVSACSDNWVSSKEVEVDLVTLPNPAVTADKPNYCSGETAILVTDIQIGDYYLFHWYKDGNLIAGSENQTSIAATTSGNYAVIVSSNISTCKITSTARQLTFTPAPIFTFNYPDELQYCEGSPVALKATGSAGYLYRWYKDDTLTGDITPTLAITQTGKYKVEVSACEGSWVPSKEVLVDFVKLPAPVLSTDKSAYCIGENAVFSTGITADPAYAINWYKDNVLLPANANLVSLSTNIPGNYFVSITTKVPNSDGSNCTQNSAPQTVIFNLIPEVTIQKTVKTTLCDGQTIDLLATYTGGTVLWSTGETTAQIAIGRSGHYDATVTSQSGCTAVAGIDVTFVANPVLNIPDATVCVPAHKTATLTAPTGLATYTWNGKIGPATYVADHAQTVKLTVTDINGCIATQDIMITDGCPVINIPNTFTPNGDGVNDTWEIGGLSYDQTCLVQIFTRYGQKVFQSRGYSVPWNGNYAGKKLATGVYYYIINAKNGTLKYSGSITMLY